MCTSQSLVLLGAGPGTAGFKSVEEQRVHFRSDWHRYNVRRKLHGRPAVTEADFERSVQDGGEVSSISGSESDSEDDAESSRLASNASTTTSQRSPEVLFVSGISPESVSFFRILIQVAG